VSARLYSDGTRRVNDLAALTAVFTTAFADQPDLADLSAPARRVLATAAALFYERGAADTSVRDLTSACGLTPGALYNHFASKDDLLYRLVQHGHDGMRRRVLAAMADCGDDPDSQFTEFVRAYLTGHLLQPELAQVVRREYLHLSPERYNEVVHLRRSFRRWLTTILEAGHNEGCFDIIGGAEAIAGQAVMVLDLCSRTSEWFQREGSIPVPTLTERYVIAARRLVGAR